MKERPILFKGAMVRSVLDDSKTQTRRVAKLTEAGHLKELGGHRRWHPADTKAVAACPYGQPGDRLWVRETWLKTNPWGDHHTYGYRASDATEFPDAIWKPSIHMPRAACRITLEIVSVRIERLQDISEADALAEGCSKNHNNYFWGGPHPVSGLKQVASAEDAYRDLWKSINGAGSWDANPWVWVVEFRRLP